MLLVPRACLLRTPTTALPTLMAAVCRVKLSLPTISSAVLGSSRPFFLPFSSSRRMFRTRLSVAVYDANPFGRWALARLAMTPRSLFFALSGWCLSGLVLNPAHECVHPIPSAALVPASIMSTVKWSST